jgi:aryl carrier-like protein
MASRPTGSTAVALRPLSLTDYQFLYDLESGPEIGPRFRHRGNTPTYEEYVANISRGVLCQYVLVDASSGNRMGLVVAYGTDFRNQHTRVSIILSSEYRRHGWPLQSADLFIRHLFVAFPIRKIYADMSSSNAEEVGLGFRRIGREEGRLRQHEFNGGEWVDLVTIAITRNEYESRDIPEVDQAAAASFEGFVAQMESDLGFASAGVGPDAKLVEDLGLDSLRLLQLSEWLDPLLVATDLQGLASLSIGELYKMCQGASMPAGLRGD